MFFHKLVQTSHSQTTLPLSKHQNVHRSQQRTDHYLCCFPLVWIVSSPAVNYSGLQLQCNLHAQTPAKWQISPPNNHKPQLNFLPLFCNLHEQIAIAVLECSRRRRSCLPAHFWESLTNQRLLFACVSRSSGSSRSVRTFVAKESVLSVRVCIVQTE